MKRRLVHLSLLFSLAVPGLAQAHDTDSQTGPLGKVTFPTQLRSEGAARVRARRRDAALVLVLGRREGVPRRARRTIPQCAIATWGIASILMSNPLAGQGASPKGAEAGAGRDRSGTPHRREDPARARLHRGGRRLLRGLRDAPGARAAGRARQGLRGARREAIPTTTKRRSSPRSTSRARSRRPTRPTRRT